MRTHASAFAPGHVTGFFEIVDDAPDAAQVGSRGAGFSVALGVQSRVSLDPDAMPGVTVLVNGKTHDAGTTRRAVQLLLGDQPLGVHVEQRMDLPVSQGFGMSSAGALSAALAVAEILGRARREAVWAAHVAEVHQRTGLGDVVGAARGGFEARARPGVEPYGDVRSWPPGGPVTQILLAVVDEAILTKRVLSDASRRAEINAAGHSAIDAFLERPDLTRFVDESRRFAIQTRLASAPLLRWFDELGAVAAVGQCMLGGSLFVFGASPEVRRRLAREATMFETEIDWQGARIVEPRTETP